jgi:hypothetical protein
MARDYKEVPKGYPFGEPFAMWVYADKKYVFQDIRSRVMQYREDSYTKGMKQEHGWSNEPSWEKRWVNREVVKGMVLEFDDLGFNRPHVWGAVKLLAGGKVVWVMAGDIKPVKLSTR